MTNERQGNLIRLAVTILIGAGILWSLSSINSKIDANAEVTKDAAWQCIEWDFSGLSYWIDECDYYRNDTELCVWGFEQDQSITYKYYNESTTNITKTANWPCTRFMMIKAPYGLPKLAKR